MRFRPRRAGACFSAATLSTPRWSFPSRTTAPACLLRCCRGSSIPTFRRNRPEPASALPSRARRSRNMGALYTPRISTPDFVFRLSCRYGSRRGLWPALSVLGCQLSGRAGTTDHRQLTTVTIASSGMRKVLLAVLLAISAPLAQGGAPADETRFSLREEFLRLINRDRRQFGLQAVQLDPF